MGCERNKLVGIQLMLTQSCALFPPARQRLFKRKEKKKKINHNLVTPTKSPKSISYGKADLYLTLCLLQIIKYIFNPMKWTEIEYLNMNIHFCHFTVTCLCFFVVFEMLKISSYAKFISTIKTLFICCKSVCKGLWNDISHSFTFSLRV